MSNHGPQSDSTGVLASHEPEKRETYLPVIEEKVQTKYPTEKGVDLLQIENSLYRIKDNEPDKREKFITKLNYEKFITKFSLTIPSLAAKNARTLLIKCFSNIVAPFDTANKHALIPIV